MGDLVVELIKWKGAGPDRSVTCPAEYLQGIPAVPRFYCYDLSMCVGQHVSCVADVAGLDFKRLKRLKLQEELRLLQDEVDRDAN